MDGQTAANSEQIGMPPTGPSKLELVPPLPEQISAPPVAELNPDVSASATPEQIVVPETVQPPVAAEVPTQASEQISVPSGTEVTPAPSAPEATAAANVIGMPPVAETAPVEALPVQQNTETTPAPVEDDKGRFGMGVIETSMPADPSKVPGWTGEVRH
ncbi:MAG: hypothetical protein WAV04_02085 [Candidatus Microsaccharimonas sp.]